MKLPTSPHPVWRFLLPAVAAFGALGAAAGLPDRVVLTWRSDPATSQAVTWRSTGTEAPAWAEYQVATDGVLAATGARVPATTENVAVAGAGVRSHTAEFTVLAPNTLYAYRVGNGEASSEWHQFRTAQDGPARFSFIYFGDAQNDIRTHWSRVFREAVRQAPDVRFTLHAGDLVNRAENDAEWSEWFGAPAWYNAAVPVVAAAGNH